MYQFCVWLASSQLKLLKDCRLSLPELETTAFPVLWPIQSVLWPSLMSGLYYTVYWFVYLDHRGREVKLY